MIIDKIFLSFAISITALVLILLTGPIILQQTADIIKSLSTRIDNQSEANGKYINMSLAFLKNEITTQLVDITSNQTNNINNMSHKLDIIIQKLSGISKLSGANSY